VGTGTLVALAGTGGNGYGAGTSRNGCNVLFPCNRVAILRSTNYYWKKVQHRFTNMIIEQIRMKNG